LDAPPPAGYGNWTALRLARDRVDIDEQDIWRFLRAQKIGLSGRKAWCQSTDPDFVATAADSVGLSMNPPNNAVVLAVDEKPSMQALERAQGYRKLPNGRAITGQSQDYKRHGTTTLVAALNGANGTVTGRPYKRRRIGSLDFMNRVVRHHPDREIHVILDNLSPQKPKRDLWLKRHRNGHVHSTPPTRPGSAKSRPGFPSWPADRCAAPRSVAFGNAKRISNASSAATMKQPARSSGPNAPSTKSSSGRVPRSHDPGY
jgi:hypothetical protein